MKKIIYSFIFLFLFAGISNAQWVKQPSPTTSDLYDVDFANKNTDFAVGTRGVVVKTTDGGVNWQLLKSPTSDDLVSVTVIDSLNVFVGSSGGPTIYKSVDGGNTWQRSLTDFTPFYITHT